MKYENMTREELIEILKSLENQRAFSYEDQMKLKILDKSPFTIWASDRNCIIKLWTRQCEELYGYKKEEALEKDFVNLFVAPDEQAAARVDQISIIDDAEIFHNIANDIGKKGNTLQLITNCFRIKDIQTGEYWNAEMGLIIDYLDQERERLEIIVSESRKVKSFIDQFINRTHECKDHLFNRKKSFRNEINSAERMALKIGKREEFKERTRKIRVSLDEIQISFEQIVESYYEKMQKCASSECCEKVRNGFEKKYDGLIQGFESVALDFEEINASYEGDNTKFRLKESILKEDTDWHTRLTTLVFERSNRLNEEIDLYHNLSNDTEPSSSHYGNLLEEKNILQEIKNEIQETSNNVMINTINTEDPSLLLEIRKNMFTEYKEIDERIMNQIEK